MYATLGDITFELLPFTDLDQRVSYDYPEHKVIEGKPLLQFGGANLDECNLGLRFHFTFCDPETEWERLKAAGDSHQALPFIFANGKVIGRYVICDIQKTICATADTGRILDLQLKVSLKEWYDKTPIATRQAAQRAAAPALGTRGTVVQPAPALGQKAALIAGQVTTSGTKIQSSAARINTLTATIQATAASAAAQLKAATAGITASVAPMMATVRTMSQDAAGTAALVQGYAKNIAEYSSAITRITSGLPGPLGKIGKQIESCNRQISKESTSVITTAQLAQGSAIEADTRALMITRMLP